MYAFCRGVAYSLCLDYLCIYVELFGHTRSDIYFSEKGKRSRERRRQIILISLAKCHVGSSITEIIERTWDQNSLNIHCTQCWATRLGRRYFETAVMFFITMCSCGYSTLFQIAFNLAINRCSVSLLLCVHVVIEHFSICPECHNIRDSFFCFPTNSGV